MQISWSIGNQPNQPNKTVTTNVMSAISGDVVCSDIKKNWFLFLLNYGSWYHNFSKMIHRENYLSRMIFTKDLILKTRKEQNQHQLKAYAKNIKPQIGYSHNQLLKRFIIWSKSFFGILLGSAMFRLVQDGWLIINVGNKFDLQHAVSYEKESFISISPSQIRNTFVSLLKELCRDIRIGTQLKQIPGATIQLSILKKDETCLNIFSKGFDTGLMYFITQEVLNKTAIS